MARARTRIQGTWLLQLASDVIWGKSFDYRVYFTTDKIRLMSALPASLQEFNTMLVMEVL